MFSVSLGGINPRLHHGTLNAIFMPAVIEFNASSESMRAEDKLSRIAQAMHLGSAEEVIPALKAMTKRLGLPTGLAQLEVTTDMFAEIIKGALADHSHKTNPREASKEDYACLLERSM